MTSRERISDATAMAAENRLAIVKLTPRRFIVIHLQTDRRGFFYSQGEKNSADFGPASYEDCIKYCSRKITEKLAELAGAEAAECVARMPFPMPDPGLGRESAPHGGSNTPDNSL